MADGVNMDWHQTVDSLVGLAEAIALLESGAPPARLSVDLGQGAAARLDDRTSPSAFLARLKTYARLCELAASTQQVRPLAPVPVKVDPAARALLDAVRRTR